MMDELLTLDYKYFFQCYENEIYRVVEGQHFIATRKLVDSNEEQHALEGMLDSSKPSAPTRNARGTLHYLLYTPFRYPPLASGGRFHTRIEQSIFYGAEALQTSMAERAYGRFLFMYHTEAEFLPMVVPYTHFVAKVKSEKAVLLTIAPFTGYQVTISHPTSYVGSQRLGKAMRAAGAGLFLYYSARAPQGINVGLFSVEAFQHNKLVPKKDGHWDVYISKDTVEFNRGKQDSPTVFKIYDFYIEGKFAAVGRA